MTVSPALDGPIFELLIGSVPLNTSIFVGSAIRRFSKDVTTIPYINIKDRRVVQAGNDTQTY